MSHRNVLSVEDSDTDFLALQCALKAAGVSAPLQRLASGRAALHWMNEAPACRLDQRTSLVLLDINLPGIDGLQLLKRVRERDPQRNVPVIVLTTSSHPRDIANSYAAGADAYMVKPLALEDRETKVGPLTDFWLKAVASRSSRADDFAADVDADERRKLREGLERAIELEIIPRLLLAHEQGNNADLPAITTTFAPDDDAIADLARIALDKSVQDAVVFIDGMRGPDTGIDVVFQQLIVPASRLVGDLWKAERCSFAQFSGALARLQQLLVELTPEAENQTRH